MQDRCIARGCAQELKSDEKLGVPPMLRKQKRTAEEGRLAVGETRIGAVLLLHTACISIGLG